MICEIETDKATMEVEAVDEGKVGRIVVAEGAEGVKVAVIAVLLEEGETEVPQDAAAPAAAPPRRKACSRCSPCRRTASGRAQARACCGSSAAAGRAASGGARIFASPLAKRIAADKGLTSPASRAAAPTAASSRLTSSPPSRAHPLLLQPRSGTRAAPPAGAQPVFVAPGDTRVPHTSIRKVIARRMLESKQTVPHFYLTVDLEIDALLAARQAINAVAEKRGAKVSVNDMMIKACAKALRDHPECNASWTEDEMIQYGAVDISVAVATDRG